MQIYILTYMVKCHNNLYLIYGLYMKNFNIYKNSLTFPATLSPKLSLYKSRDLKPLVKVWTPPILSMLLWRKLISCGLSRIILATSVTGWQRT